MEVSVAPAQSQDTRRVARQQAARLEGLADGGGRRRHDQLLDADARLGVMQRVEHVDHRRADRKLGHPVPGHQVGRYGARSSRQLETADRFPATGARDDVKAGIERASCEDDVNRALVRVDGGNQSLGSNALVLASEPGRRGDPGADRRGPRAGAG